MNEKGLLLPSWAIPLCISAIIGFGSYQVAIAEAANTKLTVKELKAKVIAEVNSAKIAAVVKAIEKNSETNERTAESLDKLIILLMQQNAD